MSEKFRPVQEQSINPLQNSIAEPVNESPTQPSIERADNPFRTLHPEEDIWMNLYEREHPITLFEATAPEPPSESK